MTKTVKNRKPEGPYDVFRLLEFQIQREIKELELEHKKN